MIAGRGRTESVTGPGQSWRISRTEPRATAGERREQGGVGAAPFLHLNIEKSGFLDAESTRLLARETRFGGGGETEAEVVAVVARRNLGFVMQMGDVQAPL